MTYQALLLQKAVGVCFGADQSHAALFGFYIQLALLLYVPHNHMPSSAYWKRIYVQFLGLFYNKKRRQKYRKGKGDNPRNSGSFPLDTITDTGFRRFNINSPYAMTLPWHRGCCRLDSIKNFNIRTVIEILYFRYLNCRLVLPHIVKRILTALQNQ